MNKILNLLGLAKKARKLVLGTDTSVAMLKSNKLTLLVIATDASDSTYDKCASLLPLYPDHSRPAPASA